MRYGIIQKDLFKEIDKKDYDKLSKEKREFYIPVKETTIEGENTIETIKEEFFIRDLDYGESAKLFRSALEELNEDKSSNGGLIIIGIVILIFGLLIGVVIGMNIGNNNDSIIQDTPPSTTTQVKQNKELPTENNEVKEIENKNIELQEKLTNCEIENIKLQTKIEYTPNIPSQNCEICEDSTLIKLELEQYKKNYNEFFTEEHKFLDFIGKTIYNNCKNTESEYCKDLYFKFRQNGF